MLTDQDVERIAEAVVRKLERRDNAKDAAKFMATKSIEEIIAHQKSIFRRKQ